MAERRIRIFVDGVACEVEEGQNLLHACLSQDIEIPYFCWHPSLGSVGACRQCAVVQYADADDQRGKLTMACMTPAAEDMRISVAAEQARKFRASVIEWLMENHPHDCPVCEEGGECHLQDMTVLTGHTTRRYRGRKRTFENQYLGPFLNHEMNRCITCYRCVRFYRDYAGGTDLQAFGSRARMYFGRETDGVLENEFSGNLVEVCPTGVFTDKPFSASFTRKWDLASAPSICGACAVGCNTFVAERYGLVKRVQNRYHGDLNGYFLCDRGRFGSGFVNSEDRIRRVGERVSGDLFRPVDRDAGIARVARLVARGGAVGIGSPRASIETNLALKRLVGDERFCIGVSAAEGSQLAHMVSIYQASKARTATISDVEQADAVLILGEDVLNTAPRVALALRQTVRNRSFEMARDAGIPVWQDAGVRSHGRWQASPVFLASVLPTRLDDVAAATFHGAPERLAEVGLDIAARLEHPDEPAAETNASAFSRHAAAALADAERPLVIAGTGPGSLGVLEAAGAVLAELDKRNGDPTVLLVPPEANSLGVALLGGRLDLEAALSLAAEAGTLIVAENDLFRRLEPSRVERSLRELEELVVLDSLDSRTASMASLVLPAATVAESTGTLVNLEGRAQRFYAVREAGGDIEPSWRWLAEAAAAAGRDGLPWTHIDDVTEAAAEEAGLTGLQAYVLAHRDGARRKVPRAPHRYSGRTAMYAAVDVHEPRAAIDDETPLAFSMEGQHRGQPSELLPYAWSPGWNSNQSIFKFQQEVGGAAVGGNPGYRLIDPASSGSYPSATFPPGASEESIAPEAGSFRLLPLYEIFGSEELSARSPPIAERAPRPYVVLNPRDAEAIGVRPGERVRCASIDVPLDVRIDAAMQVGAAGVSAGIGGVAGLPDHPVALVADPDDVIARG